MDRGITRTFAPNPHSGLRAADIAEVDRWLELASDTAGQKQLRTQRQLARERQRDRFRRAHFGGRAGYARYRIIEAALAEFLGREDTLVQMLAVGSLRREIEVADIAIDLSTYGQPGDPTAEQLHGFLAQFAVPPTKDMPPR